LDDLDPGARAASVDIAVGDGNPKHRATRDAWVRDALAAAARCTTDSAIAHAPPTEALGGAASDPCVFVPHLPRVRP
jgi:hypothetical protein